MKCVRSSRWRTAPASAWPRIRAVTSRFKTRSVLVWTASSKRAAARGVTLCCGTDLLPSDPVDGTVATIREVELLASVGLSPLQAIQAGTLNSARLCGTDRETGSLESGKAADLIVVAGRPDHNIRDLREVRLVMKGGAVFRSQVPGLV